MERSRRSVTATNPNLPLHVVELTGNPSLLDKAMMYEVSPFQTTLFLDADTMVFGDLSFAFEKAERFGLACCVNECPWARRYPSCEQHGDIVEYNTGVLAFSKSAGPVFREWKRLRDVDSSITHEGERLMAINDQASFALAVNNTGANPFVLPHNWNYRYRWHKAWFGDVRIWHDHDDPPAVPWTGNPPSKCSLLMREEDFKTCGQDRSDTESKS
jgi:hypothetical protein